MRVSGLLNGWLRRLTTLLFAFCVVPLGACSYHRAYIEYPEGTGEMPLRAGAFSGEALGPVRGGEGGAIWKDCTKVAQASVWVMIQQTQSMGGNAIGNIRWFPDRPLRNPEEPKCRQRWGWILIWPVLATPAFQVAQVEATAYRVDPAQVSSSLFFIPETRSEQAQLVEKILDTSSMNSETK